MHKRTAFDTSCAVTRVAPRTIPNSNPSPEDRRCLLTSALPTPAQLAAIAKTGVRHG
jgi:hypothetical protein